VESKRLIYIQNIINEQPYKIVAFRDELERDAERVLFNVIKYLGDENLREVLRLLKRADPSKKKKIEELEKALDKIVYIALNF